MSHADVPRGMELVQMAGWNQTEDDWAIMLKVGSGYGIHDEVGTLLASSIVISYPPQVGWIGMVLVDEAARRKGHASRLLEHVIAVLRADGLVPMLDATPAGREVYRKLGFTDVAPISRWRGVASGSSRATKSPPARLNLSKLAAAVAMDARAFGTPRTALLSDFSARPGAVTLALPDGRGALWSRAGRTATQIGPVVAESVDDAQALCAMALDDIRGPVLLDVPDRETVLAAMLSTRGFTVERPFIRMAAGASSHLLTLGAAMRVVAGPELG